MTAQEHNKYVGIANLAYGALHILMMLVTGAIFSAMIGMIASNAGKGNGLPPSFIGTIMVFAVVLNVVLAVPSFVAGYAFLNRKPWAKIAGIVAAVISAIRIPFGTLVSIYTFWFLFSEPGKSLYDRSSPALPPAPPADWNTVVKPERNAPPATAPDWR